MTATFATSAHPTGAAVCWADAESLVVELPCPGHPPCIVRYPKTATGLREALNVLLENPAPRVLPRQDHPVVKKAAGATVEQRAAAAAVVRRLFK